MDGGRGDDGIAMEFPISIDRTQPMIMPMGEKRTKEREGEVEKERERWRENVQEKKNDKSL
ncbi:hypothetical protein L484_014771 [Morus notabilis]|uniref:Uncharacterized protein n=1 Tax=Morus notabilis TaxID=981085 RepID=W9SAA1_9ROSA|nr:hypothetical protein L484_014771 [Morus notabilis]